jgi:hypothetical protein
MPIFQPSWPEASLGMPGARGHWPKVAFYAAAQQSVPV